MIKRGLELNFSNPDAHATYSIYLAVMGHLNEAGNEREETLELNPLDASSEIELGDALRAVGRVRRQLLHTKGVSNLTLIGITRMHCWPGFMKRTGRIDNSISELALSMELDQHPTHADGDLPRRTSRAAGFSAAKKALWKRQRERKKEDLKHGLPVASDLAELYAQLGDKDRAFYWLDKASNGVT